MTMQQGEEAETPPDDEVAEAERDAEAAQQRVGEIEQAILDGDGTVSAMDLVEADAEAQRKRGAVEWLRSIGERRAAREAERVRVARIAELRTEVDEQMADELLDEIVVKFDAAVADLTDMARQGVAYNAKLHDLHRELASLAPLPSGVTTSSIDGSVTTGTKGYGATPVTPVDVERLTAEAMLRALWAATGGPPQNIEQTTRYAYSTLEGGAKYGIGQRPGGGQLPWGLSDVIRWRSQGCPDHLGDAS